MLTLWPDWSYSSILAKEIIKNKKIDLIYVNSIPEIIKLVKQDIFCLVPIENRYWWVVSDTMQTIYDARDKIKIIWWKSLAIKHVLAILKNDKIENIKSVYSHPQWLRQCRIKLDKMPNIKQIPTQSTNSQICNLKKWEAVICSQEATKKANLKVIDKSFCPTDNITHFAIIWSNKQQSNLDFENLDYDRDIIILSNLPDTKWSLAKILSIIADSWLSLHFILSLARWDSKYDFPIVIDSWITAKTKKEIISFCLDLPKNQITKEQLKQFIQIL